MDPSDNFLSPSLFTLTLERDRAITFHIQKTSLPDVSLSYIPHQADVEVPIPDDRLIYTPLSTQILVDENLENYKYIYEWLLKITRTDDAHLQDVTQGSLLVYNRSYEVCQSIRIEDMSPMTLSGIEFDFSDDETKMLMNVVWEYTQFHFE